MIKESSGFNTNKIYLSFEDYTHLFNFLSKVVSVLTIENTTINKSVFNKNQLRRVDCTNLISRDKVLEEAKENISRNYFCNLTIDGLYRDYINEDLMISAVLCTPEKQSKKNINYIHPVVILKRPIFANDFDHIYVFIDSRLCTNDNFIKEINKVNDEEEIFSQEYNRDQYPISSRADYFNKIMDGIMAEVCRDCDKYVMDHIKKYNAVLSYTIYNDGTRFKRNDKKMILKCVDQIINQPVIDQSLEYFVIYNHELLRNILDENLKM